MNTPIVKTKAKRPSKGQRKHNRLVKQEAPKASVPGNDAISGNAPRKSK